MPATLDTQMQVLGSAVTTAGTITFGYPSGRSRGDYTIGIDHRLVWNGTALRFSRDFTLAFNASTVVATIVASITMAAGSSVYLELDRNGGGDHASYRSMLSDLDALLTSSSRSAVPAPPVLLNMGTPIASAATGVRTAATFTNPTGTTLATGTTLTLDGTRVTSGVATLDMPRNITVTAAGDASALTFRFTGTDEFGKTVIEDVAGPNATITQGKKAFKTVTSVVGYGATTAVAVSCGFGKVLGLPFYLPNTGHVLLEREDNAAPTAGTFVAGVTTTPSATTGDVRGTYTPNSAPDGSKGFVLLVAVANVSKGVPQFGDTA